MYQKRTGSELRFVLHFKNRISSVYEALEWFAEKYQSLNATLVLHMIVPKFGLLIQILTRSYETLMSHSNYYLRNL